MGIWQIVLNLAGLALEVTGFILIYKSLGKPDFSGGFGIGKAEDQIQVITKKTLNRFAIAAVISGLALQGFGTATQISEL